jgi:hypothetical protein
MSKNEKIQLVEKVFSILPEDEKTSETFDALYDLEIEPLRILLTLKEYDKNC